MKFLILCLLPLLLHAAEIETNQVHMADAPPWLKRTRVEKIINRIQTAMEWDIRKIEAHWYKDQASFEKSHSLGPVAQAVTKRSDNSIHLGPTVDDKNFDHIFGHELVHVIANQKYKQAIPAWLEEGLANHLAKNGTVDYKWLASQPFPKDVRSLTHPYQERALTQIRYHYVASQALAEMLAKKCDLTNLMRLSVGEDMETYIVNYCEISDLNAEFKKWVTTKGK